MATTPNFNWATPDNTGLVKNGALDIRTLGDSIDASLVDLKGGTTGQVLAKASGTDMDFSWVSDAAGMTNPMTTTGDTIYSSSGSTPARLGIGSTGQVLTVAGGVPSWATPAAGGGGKVLQVVQATSTTATTIASTTFTDTTLTATITPTSATSTILVLINQQLRFSKNSNDQGVGVKVLRGATDIFSTSGDFLYLGVTGGTAVFSHTVLPLCYLDSPATTSATTYKTQGKVDDTGSSGSSTWQQGSKMSTITLLEIGA
jgi:hypothetical protein